LKTKKFTTTNKAILNHIAKDGVLIYDIETDGLNTSTAKMKFFGAYSYKYEKYYLLHCSEREAIQNLIDEHKVLVGFNNKNFDAEILKNSVNGYCLDYKICFDCLLILYDFKRRTMNKENVIKIGSGRLMNYLPDRKLKTIGKVLGFPIEKGDIDYKIFRQDSWTEKEQREIDIYLYKDVELTRLLFEFYVEYFECFTEFVPEENIRKFDYIRQSPGGFTYQAMCNIMNIEPIYEDDPEILKLKPVNHGGYVLKPQKDYAERVVYADFASMYPHILFMCNLYSPVSKDDPKAWNGGKIFTELQSGYDKTKVGPVSKILQDIFFKRRQYKRDKNPKELALKIMINTIYGISGSPIFKNFFNMTTSGDCTYIGRTMIQYVKDFFDSKGYHVIYGDTDSCFIELPEGKTKEDFEVLAKEVIKEILDSIPFPSPETFTLEVDDFFDKVWMFGKKNYIGLSERGVLNIKGIPVKKKGASKLGQEIYEEIQPLILERKDCKWPKEFFDEKIQQRIKDDITIIGQLYNVGELSQYKGPSSIQAQISSVYGSGSHLLIPNNALGKVGKAKKYCTAEEAKTLDIKDLDLGKVYRELSPFIVDKSLKGR